MSAYITNNMAYIPNNMEPVMGEKAEKIETVKDILESMDTIFTETEELLKAIDCAIANGPRPEPPKESLPDTTSLMDSLRRQRGQLDYILMIAKNIRRNMW